MKKQTILVFVLVLFTAFYGKAQIAINANGDDPDPSAALDVSSTSRGLLTPRMLEANRTSIASPATGLLVYQTDGTEGFYYFDGNSWISLRNAGTAPSSDVGEMYEYNTTGNSSEIIISTAGNFYGWTTATSGVLNGINFNNNATADNLTVSSDGTYLVNASISFGSKNNLDIVEAAIFKNGIKVDRLSFRRFLSSGDIGVTAITGLIGLNKDDYIDMRFTINGNNHIVELEIANVNIVQVN
ncbi:MAG: hypothetical protein KQH67_05980 [Bacteroidetes bacterium]|nr:hypothetical protein [Bacteroidota bacterium]